MNKLIINQNPLAVSKLKSYPNDILPKLQFLRKLILEVAEETESIVAIEETLKWGELSYLVKKGSTLRIDWKVKSPNQYAMYFKCTSKLVETFKVVYKDTFKFENNRAILFDLVDPIPTKELKDCILMALTYHKLKDLPLLGR